MGMLTEASALVSTSFGIPSGAMLRKWKKSPEPRKRPRSLEATPKAPALDTPPAAARHHAAKEAARAHAAEELRKSEKLRNVKRSESFLNSVLGDGDGEDGESEPSTPGPPLFANTSSGRAAALKVSEGKHVAFLLSQKPTRSDASPSDVQMRRAPVRRRKWTPPVTESHKRAEEVLRLHVSTMTQAGKVIKHEFTARDLGFGVSLGRDRATDRIIVLVKETRPSCEIFDKLRPNDELVAIDGSLFVPTRLIADFKYLEEVLNVNGPRPLHLTFVHGKRRDEVFQVQEAERAAKECTVDSRGPPPTPTPQRRAARPQPNPARVTLSELRKRHEDEDLQASHVEQIERRAADAEASLGAAQQLITSLKAEVTALRHERNDAIDRQNDLQQRLDQALRNLLHHTAPPPPPSSTASSSRGSSTPPPSQVFYNIRPQLSTATIDDGGVIETRISAALEAGDARSMLRALERLDLDDEDGSPVARLDNDSSIATDGVVVLSREAESLSAKNDDKHPGSRRSSSDADVASEVVVFLSEEDLLPNLDDMLAERSSNLRKELEDHYVTQLQAKDDAYAACMAERDALRSQLNDLHRLLDPKTRLD